MKTELSGWIKRANSGDLENANKISLKRRGWLVSQGQTSKVKVPAVIKIE